MKNLKFLNCSNYSIDRYGNIFNLTSKRFLKHSLGDDGYYKITLTDDDSIRKYFRVSRLVALAFIENPHNKPVVNHIDGNKINNHVSNLEWCTISENTVHSYSTGLQTISGGYPVTDYRKVHDVCKLLEQGVRPKEVSEIVGITNRKVVDIRNGTYWKDISEQYNLNYVKKEYKMQLGKVNRICEMLANGMKIVEIAKVTGTALSPIYRIKNRQSYIDISSAYVW